MGYSGNASIQPQAHPPPADCCLTFLDSSENQSDLAAQHQNAILYKDLRKAIDTLKTQHVSLTKVVQEPLSAAPRSLPNAVAEEAAHSPRAASPRYPYAPFKYPHPHRASYAASITSDGELEWFDAEDGAEEFHFDTNDSPPTGVREEQPSRTTTTIDTTSMFEDQDSDDDSSIDTDLGVDEPTEIISPGVDHSRHTYRTQLPAPPPEDEGSLFTILKKNVGKVRPPPSRVLDVLESIFKRIFQPSPSLSHSTSL